MLSLQNKSMDCTALQPLAASDAGSPVVFEKSPTLLAGLNAGRQGMVRLWAPSLPTLKHKAVLGAGLVAFVALAVSLSLSLDFWIWLFTIGVGQLFQLLAPVWESAIALASLALIALLPAVAALRKPCYVAADDAGLGVTTAKGSQVVRWNEVAGVERLGLLNTFLIRTTTGKSVRFSPHGFSARSRNELWNTMARKAQRQLR